MVHQNGIFDLDLKPLISQCSPCLRVIELPILGLMTLFSEVWILAVALQKYKPVLED
jgi:hypothetical protein